MKLLCVAIAFLVTSSIGALTQENSYSGGQMLEGCELWFSSGRRAEKTLIMSGMCMGVVATVVAYKDKASFCMPEGSDYVQGLRVLLKYLNDNPAELHEELYVLVERAFGKAWPCKR